MRLSRKYYIFIIALYAFALQFGIMKRIGAFQYWDEFYAFLCIPLIIVTFNGKIKIKKKDKYINRLIIPIFLFVLVGVLSNYIYKYQNPIVVLQDIFINLKFFMGILTTYFIFSKFELNKYQKRIGFHVKLLITLYFTLTILNKYKHIFETADVRFGLEAEKIFFNHPTELASATFFLLLMLVITDKNVKDNLLFVGMTVIIILLTLRFKAIAAVMIFIYLYIILMFTKKIRIIYLLPLIPFVILIGGNEFYFYFFGENTMDMARGALSFTSLIIAKDTFPFGTGFGTFASWMSGVHYSPVYKLYGIDNVYGLTEDWPQLVSDVFWPMILAQNGIIGLALYIIIIYYLFMLIIRYSKNEKKMLLVGLGALSYLLVSSIAESAFVNPLSVSLAFIIGICICDGKQKERDINI